MKTLSKKQREEIRAAFKAAEKRGDKEAMERIQRFSRGYSSEHPRAESLWLL